MNTGYQYCIQDLRGHKVTAQALLFMLACISIGILIGISDLLLHFEQYSDSWLRSILHGICAVSLAYVVPVVCKFIRIQDELLSKIEASGINKTTGKIVGVGLYKEDLCHKKCRLDIQVNGKNYTRLVGEPLMDGIGLNDTCEIEYIDNYDTLLSIRKIEAA